MKTEDLINAKKQLESTILKAVKEFEKETTLRVNAIDIDRHMYSYPNSSTIDAIHVESIL